jgi:hypothetical protein
MRRQYGSDIVLQFFVCGAFLLGSPKLLSGLLEFREITAVQPNTMTGRAPLQHDAPEKVTVSETEKLRAI